MKLQASVIAPMTIATSTITAVGRLPGARRQLNLNEELQTVLGPVPTERHRVSLRDQRREDRTRKRDQDRRSDDAARVELERSTPRDLPRGRGRPLAAARSRRRRRPKRARRAYMG